MRVDRVYLASQWPHAVGAGDLVVAIDGTPVKGDPMVVAEVGDYGLRIEAPAGAVERRLYRGNHDSVTIQRDEPYTLTRRERAALRRNPRYARLLASLLDGPRLATDRGEGVSFASMSDVYDYGWTERGPRRMWQITERGREALAAYQRSTPS